MCNFIDQLINKLPDQGYIFLKDDGMSTQLEISQAVSNGVGNEKVENMTMEDALLQEDFDIMNINIKFQNSDIPFEFEWV